MIIINAKLKVAAEHREAYLSLMKDLVDAHNKSLVIYFIITMRMLQNLTHL